MPRSNNDEGTNPFEVRPKTGGMPTWGGMFRRGDPSQVPPNRFHSLLNVRLNEGEVNNRPGLAYVAGTEEEACITGLFEVNQDPDCISIFFNDNEIHPSGATPNGTRITRFNEEETPPYRGYWPGAGGSENEITKRDASISDAFRTLQFFRGRLLGLANQGGVGYLWNVSYSSSGDDHRVDLSVEFSPNEATYGNIVDMCVRSENSLSGTDVDMLYLSTDAGKILRWDGATLSVSHTMAAAERTRIICIQGNKLFAAAGTSGGCAYQADPSAAWVDLVWPAGKELAETWDLTEFQGLLLISGKPDLFGPGATNYVHGWNPASPATVAVVWTWTPPPAISLVVLRAVVRANVWYALVCYSGFMYVARATSVGSAPDWTWSLIGGAFEDPAEHLGFLALVGGSLVFWYDGVREVDPETGTISVVYGPLVNGSDYTTIPIETFVI